MAHIIKISARALAEFLLRSGSIDSRFGGLRRAQEGSRLHRWLQKQGGRAYRAEVPLSIEMQAEEFVYRLSGRADGVIDCGGGILVDEIKTTAAPLESINEGDNPAHWAQGCIYAHILCCDMQLEKIGVQLTYCNTDTLELRRFEREYTAEQLREYVQGLLGEYARWARMEREWKQRRDASLQRLAFPFEAYREGQRKLAVACYQTYKQGGRLFACAPTGIGKTVSTLFPALKAMGEGYGEKIFYLTARTITRQAAEGALALLRAEQPMELRSLTLTAKDKLCFLEQRACTPEACPYADGYYDRANEAVYQLLQESMVFGREQIENAAKEHRLCPYELSLDMAQWCDCVIGDYNYLFDPVVRLQRFFEGAGGEYLFLVDEAHNLVDRSREMYSAALRKGDFFAFKKLLPKRHTRLHKALAAINSGFVALRHACEAEDVQVLARRELPAELQEPVEKFIAAAEAFLEQEKGSEWEQPLLELYFAALFYQRIAEEYGEHYVTLIYRRGGEVTARLFCLDPAQMLDESLALGRAAVLFSATLQPLAYYRRTLGGGDEARLLRLGSPFTPENLGLFVADGISTKYTDRERSLEAVADIIAEMAAARRGNYIAYFPSYSYMRQVLGVFCERHPDVEVLEQQTGMDEAAREEFLEAFAAGAENTLVGFCVLGGIFAEGVDLVGERLIGTAIVGVGLPQMGPEPDALRRYYDNMDGDGFAFAYQYPGMNKVLQAAGRVIRTESDKGVVVLIDSRFGTGRYLEMFPQHWGHWRRAGREQLGKELAEFWQEN